MFKRIISDIIFKDVEKYIEYKEQSRLGKILKTAKLTIVPCRKET